MRGAPKRQKRSPTAKAKRKPARRKAQGLKADQPAGLVTRAVLAAKLGVAPNRINKMVDDGGPVEVHGSRGHSSYYDLEKFLAWRTARGRPDRDPGLSLGAARARLAEAQAKKWERENLLRAGELMERRVAIAEGHAHIIAAKARLLSIPRQAIMRGIVGRENERALYALVVEALEELGRWQTASDAHAALAAASAEVPA